MCDCGREKRETEGGEKTDDERKRERAGLEGEGKNGKRVRDWEAVQAAGTSGNLCR